MTSWKLMCSRELISRPWPWKSSPWPWGSSACEQHCLLKQVLSHAASAMCKELDQVQYKKVIWLGAESITFFYYNYNRLWLSGLRVSWYQKGKTNLDFLEQGTVSGSGISWAICKSAPRPRQITTPAPYHSGHCHSLFLALVKSRLDLPFWYWLTRVILEKGPFNRCCGCCITSSYLTMDSVPKHNIFYGILQNSRQHRYIQLALCQANTVFFLHALSEASGQFSVPSFLQAGCLSGHTTNSVEELKALSLTFSVEHVLLHILALFRVRLTDVNCWRFWK